MRIAAVEGRSARSGLGNGRPHAGLPGRRGKPSSRVTARRPHAGTDRGLAADWPRIGRGLAEVGGRAAQSDPPPPPAAHRTPGLPTTPGEDEAAAVWGRQARHLASQDRRARDQRMHLDPSALLRPRRREPRPALGKAIARFAENRPVSMSAGREPAPRLPPRSIGKTPQRRRQRGSYAKLVD